MHSFKGIPIRSGEKYRTAQGFTAIKDGMKSRAPVDRAVLRGKPRWLKAPLASGIVFDAVRRIVREHRLSTVCEEAKCPNIGECWNAGTATIMVMGAVCTRACRFCSVDTGNPHGWLDAEEPVNVAHSVSLMKLKYVVLTSVDRDDLADGGASHYAACVRAIKSANPGTAVEALTPDFQGVLADVETVIDSGVDVYAQNIETVRRLTHPVRDPRAGYEQTLDVLAHAKRYRPSVLTKTSLMLGLGEHDPEIATTMDDLRHIGVDILTLGQYLRPTAHHLPVERFVTPEEFERYRAWGLERGFLEVVSGPLVRSSYRAERALERNNAGLMNSSAAAGRWRAEPPGTFHAPTVRHLGTVEYEPTWRAMREFTDDRGVDTADQLWILEHPPVYTLGLNGRREHVLAPRDIPVIQVDRGGQVTYHGPGQLVVYPLLDLKRLNMTIRDLVVRLENAVIELCAGFGVNAAGRRDAPGVYVEGRKLASIGLRVRRGCTYHGLALNVMNDLEPFSRINPCGFAGLQVTRLADLAPIASLEELSRRFEPIVLRHLTARG